MNFKHKIELLKKNFARVEERHADFFANGIPRWPGEKQDFLRNHHQNLENFPLHRFEFERLGFRDLPDIILADLKTAFAASENGQEHIFPQDPS